MFNLLMMVKIMNHQVIMNLSGYVVIILILFINFHKVNDLNQIQMLLIQLQLMKYEYRRKRILKSIELFVCFFFVENIYT
jgi:hypothetical protein